VTVYIPTYNYAPFLEKAIKSVFHQTMSDWELIIIDDGSTDNTSDILGKFRSHPKIRIVEQENKGLNVTNNIAIRLSTGRYIMRLDADDYMDENILLVLSNVLDQNSKVGLVYPDYYCVDEEENVIEIVRRKKIGVEVELLDLPAHGACTMIRKECFFEVGGYTEEFACQDGYDLWLKMINRFKPINVNIPLFYYRQHQNSLTRRQDMILDTRRRVKSRFIEANNLKRPKVLGIIPITIRNTHPMKSAFTVLAGHPLIWYTLNEVQKVETLDRVVLTSDDNKVLEYGKKFEGIETLSRPAELSKAASRAKNVAQYVIDELGRSSKYRSEAVCILHITSPLRKAKHIEKTIDTMTIFDVESVITVCEELSYCYHHRHFGLQPISNSKRKLRQERDAIYKENGAVILSRTEVLEKGRLLGKNIGHTMMLPEESVKISNDFDFWLAEKIILERNCAGTK